MIRTILVSALLASTASVALAADIVEPAPAAPEVVEEAQVYSWDGAYLGVFGGANWLRGELRDGTGRESDTPVGGTIGKFGGWNMQLDNNIVLGIEGDLKYDWNEHRYSGVKAGTDWGGSARLRAGYAFDSVLLYAAGGWTAANAYANPKGNNNNNNNNNDEKVLNGWTLGAGADYMFNQNMFARAEYRFNDYGNEKIGGAKVDFQQHNFLLGVGYKF